ncbi:MAG: glycosyltransferase family 4 protein [Desulfobacterales bacterium]
MKIALVNHTFSLSRGGLERFSVNLAAGLSKKGHSVHVFGQRFADLPPEVVLHPIHVPKWPRWRRICSFQFRVSKAVKNEPFDITYALTRFYPADLYRMGDGLQVHWMRIRYSNPVWRWINCLINPVHIVNLWLEKKILKDTGCKIIANSLLCKHQAQHYYGLAADRISVVYNGVDFSIFGHGPKADVRDRIREKIGLTPEDVAILHISNNWKRKGLACLMKAVANLKDCTDHRLHIVVVGRGRPERFAALSRRLNLKNRLHFIGETQQVEAYYTACDLMVLPTMYDPFSNVCLEAMASGLPVITTAQNGASELIRNWENGFIQKDPRDPSELSGLIRNCLHPLQRSEMGKAARRTSITFTLDKNLDETSSVIASTLAHGKSNGYPRSRDRS